MTQNRLLTFTEFTKNGTVTLESGDRSQSRAASRQYSPRHFERIPILVVVEGTNDIEFLRRVSTTLSSIDHTLPNLHAWENEARLIFLPFGGGSVLAWGSRLGPLQLPEFHLYDRETARESDVRVAAAKVVNSRPNCCAVVTRKRSLENYLHPAAIFAADGLAVDYCDHTSVTDAVAKAQFLRRHDSSSWESLPKRARDRWSRRTKRWLNSKAVDQMTPEMLAKSDPQQEIVSWFRQIRDLAEQSR